MTVFRGQSDRLSKVEQVQCSHRRSERKHVLLVEASQMGFGLERVLELVRERHGALQSGHREEGGHE